MNSQDLNYLKILVPCSLFLVRMNNLLSNTQLLSSFSNQHFVLKTQRQIAKDFAKFNLLFPDNFETELHSKAIIEELIAERITEIMQEGETRLLQLLYTIDLSEKEFLSITTEPDFLKLLSEKILMREAYKVFLREKFN
jgi:hypothetical protein